MKISKSDYNNLFNANVVNKMPSELKEAHNFYKESIQFYEEVPEVKEAIDLYLENVSDWMEKAKSKPKQNSGKEKKSTTSKSSSTAKKTSSAAKKRSNPAKKKSTPRKSTTKKPASKSKATAAKRAKTSQKETGRKENAKAVNKISAEVRFAKRAKSLHEKVATKTQIAAFVKALQRAILNKEIRKNSPHADFIMDMQRMLVNFHNGMSKSQEKFNLPATLLKKAVDLSDDERVRDSVRLVNRYIGLINTDKVASMKRLLEAIEKAIKQGKIKKDDDYYSVINSITKKLKNHTSNHTVLDATQTELAGLQDVLKKYNILPSRPAQPKARKASAVKKK
ncbi:HD-GYP domain-containing protein (c-di-GMP phosphodiesterase class II) [Catalinimonas alkaloidigena]|uniref:hypothetical protein n=1 Tax=Catalinimonas alkaloidigena TaxID=1075417 RepID=UPI002406AD10|nr:hypothetical protein [Catalinimonas alkaloidigena]MDF9799784.1 HD-GYP domain-containing protein (c-di-GMP phosphodiesterase class II) [Catalinimonas alkaloidigena]